jgi:hypothetical protein
MQNSFFFAVYFASFFLFFPLPFRVRTVVPPFSFLLCGNNPNKRLFLLGHIKGGNATRSQTVCIRDAHMGHFHEAPTHAHTRLAHEARNNPHNLQQRRVREWY